MQVRAAHPVPVRHIPVGARKERLAFVRREVDCEVPELSPSDFDRVDLRGQEGKVPTFVRDGGVWITQFRTVSPLGPGNFPSRELAAWLAADPAGPGTDFNLGERLRRTPLVASIGSALGKKEWTRIGIEPDRLVAREIRSDHAARAAAAVRAHLRDDYAIVGDEVRTRIHPLAEVSGSHPRSPMSYQFYPLLREGDASRFVTMSTLDLTKPRDGWNPTPAAAATIAGSLRPGHGTVEGARYFALAYAEMVSDGLAALERLHPGAAGEDLPARLLVASDLARIGVPSEDDFETTLDLVARGATVLARHARELDIHRLGDRLRWFREGVAALPKADIAHDDVEAFDALMP